MGAMSRPAIALPTCNQQSTLTRPIELGASGGNINSTIKVGRERGCSSGTLGSLVEDQNSVQYILSNNHVLADVNKAKKGQLIIQPGLVDVDCSKIKSDAVAKFSRTVKIKFGNKTNTIDAAIAAVEPGDVSADILNIGEIAGTVVAASPGMSVEKMGRTTCFTTGSISAVGVNGTVNYSETGGKKLAKFVNQIVIDSSGPPNNFGGPGDSGSLIVTQESCPEAVGLLFAGSGDETETIANPITAVLSGLNVSMVGSCTAAISPDAAQPDVMAGDVGMSKEVVESAKAVRDRHEDELMKIPGAVGTGIGLSEEPDQPAIVVYVKKKTPQTDAATPKEVEGVPVKIIENGGFIAY
jgi:hypothetical protein